MARNQATISVSEDEWTQLTNDDVSTITFQAVTGDIYVRFTADETQPAAALEGVLYQVGFGVQNESMTNLTALSGADRVWARSVNGAADVYVDHA